MRALWKNICIWNGCDSNTSSNYLFLFNGDQQLWMVRILQTSERMAFKWMKLGIEKLAARETIRWTFFSFGQLSGACANFWSHIWWKKTAISFGHWIANMPSNWIHCIFTYTARDRVRCFPFNCCFVPFRHFCYALHKYSQHTSSCGSINRRKCNATATTHTKKQ